MMPELMIAIQNATEVAHDTRPGVNEQTVEWLDHEHIALTVQIEAQKLLDEAGSVESATQAIDEATDTWSEDVWSRRETFAHHWGFDSYISLLQCSMPITSAHRKNWNITAVSDGRWIMWNDEDLVAEARFRPLGM